MTAIKGNTYPVKDALKAIGGRWNPDQKVWMVPDEVADKARKIVDVAPAVSHGGGSFSRRSSRSYCDECGDNVTPGTRCWETGLTH